MSYNHTSIKTIIDHLNRTYFIPDIQRTYVWLQNPKAKKIEQLFDSLMRGYPIGAFLFWELKTSLIQSEDESEEDKNKLNFQLYEFIEDYDVRHPHNKKINVSKITSDEIRVVLDGQQRLTSLYIGLRGSRCLKRAYSRSTDPNQYEEKKLYLNLSHTPDYENPDDSFQFEFKTPIEASISNEEEQWFRVGKVMDFASRNDMRDYCRKKGYTLEQQDLVEELWTVVVNKEDVITFFEEKEKNLDKVLKIFIRVNSGGMQLSYSDLLMSLLTATFKTEIREQMDSVVDRLKEEGFACFGRDQILKTCLMLSGLNHVFKMENFSKKNIREMEGNWDKAVSTLYAAVALLKGMGYAGQLSSGYILTTICLYLFKKDILKPQKEDKKAMLKFVQIAQMRSYFTSSLDSKLTQVKDTINNTSDFTSFLEEMNKLPEFGIDSKYLEWTIENIKYGSPAVLPVLQTLYPTLNYGSVVFHIDHIFPKSKFKKKNVELPPDYIGKENNLWNLQLLEGIANEEKKAKDPRVWIKGEYEEDAKRQTYLNNNYIPKEELLEWQSIAEFEKERKNLMLQQLVRNFDIISE